MAPPALLRLLLPLAFLLSGSPAQALIDHLAPIYEEDFEGEVVFPATPELDVLALGPISDLAVGNGSPSILLDGSSVVTSISATPGFFFHEQAIIGLGTSSPLGAMLGARTVLSGYDATVVGVGQTFAGLVFTRGSAVTANLQRFVSSLAPQDDLLGIVVSEIDSLSSGLTTVFDFVILDAATRAAVEAGASVLLELLLDEVSGTASARATIGSLEVTTGSIVPTLFGSVGTTSMGLFAGVTNVFQGTLGPFDLGGDDSLSVAFERFELRAVPEPGAAALLGIGLLGLGLRRRASPKKQGARAISSPR